MSTIFKNKNLGRGNGTYFPDVNLSRRNPILTQKLSNPIPCFYCKEYQKDRVGREKRYRNLNSLFGHASFDHQNENYRNYVLGLVKLVISGDIK